MKHSKLTTPKTSGRNCNSGKPKACADPKPANRRKFNLRDHHGKKLKQR